MVSALDTKGLVMNFLHNFNPNRKRKSSKFETFDYDVRDNLSSWTGVVDVSDNALLNFELLVQRGHFPE